MSCSSLSHIATFLSSLFLHFLLHPFIICLIPFHLLLSSSNVVSLYERWVLWCTSPIVWRYSFGCRLSHLTHMILWYLALCTGVWHLVIGYLGLCFPSFHSLFIPSLHYGPSRKTTLRPWDLLPASTRFIWTGSVYWLSTGCRQVSIASGNIEGHILPFHSVCLPRFMIRGRWYKELGPLSLMLWHVHTGAYPHPCMLASALTHVRRQSISPRDVLDIRVWVSTTFSLVFSYNRVLLRADLRSNS